MSDASILSIFANSVAVVGLADCICRLGTELYHLYQRGSSSHNVAQLLDEVHALISVVTYVRIVDDSAKASTSDESDACDSVQTILLLCERELVLLKSIGPTFISSPGDGVITRLETAWRLITQDQRIADSAQRLHRLTASLSAALSAVGRQNDIKISRQLSVIRGEVAQIAALKDLPTHQNTTETKHHAAVALALEEGPERMITLRGEMPTNVTPVLTMLREVALDHCTFLLRHDLVVLGEARNHLQQLIDLVLSFCHIHEAAVLRGNSTNDSHPDTHTNPLDAVTRNINANIGVPRHRHADLAPFRDQKYQTSLELSQYTVELPFGPFQVQIMVLRGRHGSSTIVVPVTYHFVIPSLPDVFCPPLAITYAPQVLADIMKRTFLYGSDMRPPKVSNGPSGDFESVEDEQD